MNVVRGCEYAKREIFGLLKEPISISDASFIAGVAFTLNEQGLDAQDLFDSAVKLEKCLEEHGEKCDTNEFAGEMTNWYLKKIKCDDLKCPPPRQGRPLPPESIKQALEEME